MSRVFSMTKPGARAPLDPASFPANLQMHVGPTAPPPMKMMAARGMVPAPPVWSLRVLYQLSFDADVQAAVLEHVGQVPANILLPSLQEEQPADVLDWVAELRKDSDLVNAILANPGASDEMVARMASVGSTEVCDFIASNQVRILRSPAILEQLYKNPNARMATVDKLVDLASRNGVKLTGLPELQAAIDSGIDLDLDNEEESGDFDLLMEEDKLRRQKEDQEEEVELTASQKRAAKLQEAKERRMKKLRKNDKSDEVDESDENSPLYVQIRSMKLSKKIRFATTGSREAVMLLIKDSNRLVHMAAVKNPRLQYSDVRKLSSMANMPDGVIRAIAKNKEWTQHYEVMCNLVNNPKTPLAEGVKFLAHLRTNDLRDLQRSRNISPQIKRQAKSLLAKRT